MNMINYVNLKPGIYNLYKPIKLFGFEIYKSFVGSITVNEDRSYMTTSYTKYHSKIFDYPALCFCLKDNGNFNLDKYFMKYFSTRFFLIQDKEEIQKYINDLMYFLKDVKYIIKYIGN